MFETSGLLYLGIGTSLGGFAGNYVSGKFGYSKGASIAVGCVIGLVLANIVIIEQRKNNMEKAQKKRLADAEISKQKMIASGQMLSDGSKNPTFQPVPSNGLIEPIKR